ncbi:MAG TPA: hypothetical protein VGL81_18225 [Polyangiaceae bacterium]|jgi:hypothetical protein
MSADDGWRGAFLAVSSLLGEGQDVAAAALGDAAARELAGPLGSTSRQVRAAAVARTVAGLLAELERARLA